jgi:hypothetical protein
MPYLFLAFAAVAIAAFASLKFTLSLFFAIALVTVVVKIAATQIMGPVSFGAAARSVAWACILPVLAVLALLSLFKGQVQAEGFLGFLILLGLFASFVLGFKHSLGASFGASAVIAVISTLTSAVLLFALKPLMF